MSFQRIWRVGPKKGKPITCKRCGFNKWNVAYHTSNGEVVQCAHCGQQDLPNKRSK